MVLKTVSVLMAATLTLFAAEAAKAPVASPAKEKTQKDQKASPAAVATPAATTAAKAPNASTTSTGNQVNINTATVADLQKLHGIGAAKAQAIVDYRKAHGEFKNTADLVNVPGIGDKVFAGFKNDVKTR